MKVNHDILCLALGWSHNLEPDNLECEVKWALLTITTNKASRGDGIPEFQKSIYVWFIDNAKIFDCVDHNKLWKILKEMGILDHFTCFLWNLYAGQEAALELDMEQLTGQNWERNMTWLYIVPLLI